MQFVTLIVLIVIATGQLYTARNTSRRCRYTWSHFGLNESAIEDELDHEDALLIAAVLKESLERHRVTWEARKARAPENTSPGL